MRRGLEPIRALEVEVLVCTAAVAARGTLTRLPEAPIKTIIQAYGMWPGLWSFYSASGIGKWNHTSASACNSHGWGHRTEARGEETCSTCLAHFLWLLRNPSLDLRAQRDFPTLAAH